MTSVLSVNEFWKKARELLVALWNRTEKRKVQWMERDWAWDEGMRDLARLCRSDQEQSRFKWMQEHALGLMNRTRVTITDYDDWPKVKLNAEGKAHFMKAVRDMNEERWNYSKRSDAISRIANYWVRKGEDEEDVSGWLSEQIHREWDLSFKYEDWKYGDF